MKKALKIAGITLACLLGLVLIAAVIVVSTVGSPERLTKILKHYAPQYVNCEMQLDRASLTLFKTFPNVGVDIEHVALINPMEGSSSDTLVNIDDLTVVLDLKKLLKEKTIEVRECVLDKAFVNIHINMEGETNLNVFNTKEDTGSDSFSFDHLVDIEKIKLKNSTVFITEESTDLTIHVNGLDMDMNGKFENNDINAEINMVMDDFYLNNYATPFELTNVNVGFIGSLKQFEQIEGIVTVEKPGINLSLNELVLNDETLSISLPFLFSLKTLKGHYEKGQANIQDYHLYVNGDVEIAENGELVFDCDVKSNIMDLTVAHAKVAINSNSMPFIFLTIQADDLAVNVPSLSNPRIDLDADVLLTIDLTKTMSDSIDVMKGKFQLYTDLLDVKEIVKLVNTLSSTEESKPKETESKAINPFMVPKGIDLTVDVKTKKTVYGNIDFNNLKGKISMKDNALVLDRLSFTNKAADMQLSALYQSPNKDNLFFAMDFHLMNVQIKDLLHLIPYFDTLVPMLKTFDGQCEFNINAETKLKPNYQPEISTLLASADVRGKDLTVTDQFTFTKITNMLHVSTNDEYHVDTLDVQLDFLDSQLNLWPSQIAIGRYKAIVEGFMTTDKNTEFHLALTESPFHVRHGLKVSGPVDKLKFELEASKYPHHYKPITRSERKQYYLNHKQKIADKFKEKFSYFYNEQN